MSAHTGALAGGVRDYDTQLDTYMATVKQRCDARAQAARLTGKQTNFAAVVCACAPPATIFTSEEPEYASTIRMRDQAEALVKVAGLGPRTTNDELRLLYWLSVLLRELTDTLTNEELTCARSIICDMKQKGVHKWVVPWLNYMHACFPAAKAAIDSFRTGFGDVATMKALYVNAIFALFHSEKKAVLAWRRKAALVWTNKMHAKALKEKSRWKARLSDASASLASAVAAEDEAKRVFSAAEDESVCLTHSGSEAVYDYDKMDEVLSVVKAASQRVAAANLDVEKCRTLSNRSVVHLRCGIAMFCDSSSSMDDTTHHHDALICRRIGVYTFKAMCGHCDPFVKQVAARVGAHLEYVYCVN